MSTDTDLGAILDADHGQPDVPMAPMAQPEPQGDKQQAAEPPSATSQEAPEPPHVPRDALLDERRKRQEIERQYRELQARMQQQPEPENKPDWFTDPESAAARERQQFQQQLFETRVELSETLMREKHQDYESMRDVFAEAAVRAAEAGNPQLQMQLSRSPNPAKFAYEMGRRIHFQREVGDDPGAYREKLKAELMKELGLGHEPGAAPAPQRATAQVPRSLAKESSAPPRAGNGRFVSNGPTPLEDILG